MALSSLCLRNVRNLQAVDLEPAGTVNLLSGANASGKTSVLEGLYFLARGRSFRTRRVDRMVRNGAQGMAVYGRLAEPGGRRVPLGVERQGQGTRMRLGGRAVGVSALAAALPVQLIHPGSHRLLEEGPQHRREFLDWGVFHVEPMFLGAWQRFRRALKQRNAALRSSDGGARAWDRELVAAAEMMDDARRRYVERLQPALAGYVEPLLGDLDLQVHYRRGWSDDRGLAATLEADYGREREQGFTGAGPHRAELAFRIQGISAVDRVSRGQQKLLIVALLLAQAGLFQELTGRRCVLLIDDVAAELDEDHRQRVMARLRAMQVQAFVTAIDHRWVTPHLEAPDRLFHVEHGGVIEMV